MHRHGDLPVSARALRPSRRAVSFRWVAVGLGALAVVALVIGLAAYVELLRFRRVAAHHLPGDTRAALRIDVEQVVLYEPVRKHLIPLIDAAGTHGAGRVDRLRTQGGINLGLQLREVVIGFGPTPADWVVVVGGLFDARVLDRVEAVLRAEGTAVARKDGELALGDALFAAEADDGALVFGPSPDRVRSALRQQPTFGRLGLQDSGPGGFAVAEPSRRFCGTFELAPELRVSIRGAFSGEGAPERARAFETELRAWLHEHALAPKGSIRVSAQGADVEAWIPGDLDALDRAVAALADTLRPWVAGR